jgi:Glyoxalase/Bleomycin resistance protein/Dioxygenase superfamily
MGVGDTGTLHHTCWVVEDLDATAKKLAKDLSLSWGVWTIAPEVCTVHGENVPYSFRVAIANVGDANMELIQPLEGQSVYAEQLASVGPGFHHTCFIYPSFEAVRRARDVLAAQGREMIQSGDLGELGAFYYYAIPETASVLELLFLTELPPPETVIE